MMYITMSAMMAKTDEYRNMKMVIVIAPRDSTTEGRET